MESGRAGLGGSAFRVQRFWVQRFRVQRFWVQGFRGSKVLGSGVNAER